MTEGTTPDISLTHVTIICDIVLQSVLVFRLKVM